MSSTITIERAKLEQALEALDLAQSLLEKSRHHSKIIEAYTAIKQPLEQPVQEPVAFKVIRGELCYKSQDDDQSYGMWCPVTSQTGLPYVDGTEFYTTPPAAQRQWVGLTDEEISEAYNAASKKALYRMGTTREDVYEAIEAKLKEKNI